MPPAPELINSSSIYYRESHSSPVQPRQSQPLLWDDYRGKDHHPYDTYNNDATDDDKSIVTLKKNDIESHQDHILHCPRSHRLEFAVFVKILFKLLDNETAAVKSQAKAMISSCLEKVKQGDNKNYYYNFCSSSSSSSSSSSRSSNDSGGDDHHGRLSSSLLFQLENMELPLRSLVGESVWVCAYHYTKLYQQKHHRPSRIFRSNMQFNRDWLDYESSSPPPSLVPLSSVSVSTTTVPRLSSMGTASHPGCSTVSLSSASDELQDPSSDEWDYLEASFAGEESLYPHQDNLQGQDYHDYFDGGNDAVAAADDDDVMVEPMDNLEPTSPTLITSDEVETEYYNFLRDAF